MTRFVIEHPTRGVYVDSYFDDKLQYKPKFAWSIGRGEGFKFFSRESAQKEINKWPQLNVAARCYITEVSK